jgi:hypothetical protein
VSDEFQTTAAAPAVGEFTSPGAEPSLLGGPQAAASSAAQTLSDRPELIVGGAFAGGFLLAKLLRRRGS